jgi:D-alanine-D-alanine ligase
MRLAIAYNAPVPGAPDATDVLQQVELVGSAMSGYGHEVRRFPLASGPGSGRRLLEELAAWSPAAVFNLIEPGGVDPRAHALAAGWLAAGDWAVTGASSLALFASTDKTLGKAVLQAHGVPTPAWQVVRGRAAAISVPAPWIVKPAWEDASLGIDDRSVVRDLRDLPVALAAAVRDRPGQPVLVESYVEGREFNVSLLEHPDGRVEVLPPAEIRFEDWPADKPRIVNYAAKWDPAAFEFSHTPRRYDLEPRIAADLRRLGLACWEAFELTGYARVDLRRGPGQAWFVIEVNANPCLSPDAGFMAAVRQGGRAPADALAVILATALRRSPARPAGAS